MVRSRGATLLGILFGPGDSLFDFPNTGEVLVELGLVIAAESFLQSLGVGGDQVENALANSIASLADLCVFFGSEQPAEDRSGIDLFGDRRRGGLPGDVGRVGTAVAGIAVAGIAATFDSDLK